MTAERPSYTAGIYPIAGSRGIYRLNGKFDLEVPQISWHKEYNNDDIILTAELSDSLLQGAEDIILTLHQDGSVGKAF